jgi:hypothetical protein
LRFSNTLHARGALAEQRESMAMSDDKDFLGRTRPEAEEARWAFETLKELFRKWQATRSSDER